MELAEEVETRRRQTAFATNVENVVYLRFLSNREFSTVDARKL